MMFLNHDFHFLQALLKNQKVKTPQRCWALSFNRLLLYFFASPAIMSVFMPQAIKSINN